MRSNRPNGSRPEPVCWTDRPARGCSRSRRGTPRGAVRYWTRRARRSPRGRPGGGGRTPRRTARSAARAPGGGSRSSTRQRRIVRDRHASASSMSCLRISTPARPAKRSRARASISSWKSRPTPVAPGRGVEHELEHVAVTGAEVEDALDLRGQDLEQHLVRLRPARDRRTDLEVVDRVIGVAPEVDAFRRHYGPPVTSRTSPRSWRRTSLLTALRYARADASTTSVATPRPVTLRRRRRR